ncbi:neuronal acetylcholine receptor subunit alpha-6-like [Glandiceps talaboti]
MLTAWICWFAVLTLSCKGANVTLEGHEVEGNLRGLLFSYYDKSVRPSLDTDSPVVVNVALSLTQLLDVDEKKQVITVSVWLYQIWKDYRLKWDPQDHEGIRSLPILAGSVWYPDTGLYTSASEEHSNFPTVITDSVTALVQYDGNVTACSARIYLIPCRMDIIHFPFDKQSCSLAIGTWVHNVTQLDYNAMFDKVQQEGFIRNTEWSLLDSRVDKYLAEFIVFPGTYSYMTFTLFMKRKSLYYIVNLILPCVLFSLLTVTVFFLPPNCNDRITMGVSILLTLFVFNLLVADIMPPTSDNVPGLSLYLLFNMASVVGVIVISAFLLSLYSKRGPVPSCLRAVFIQILAKLVCVRNEKKCLERRSSKISPSSILERYSVPNNTNQFEFSFEMPSSSSHDETEEHNMNGKMSSERTTKQHSKKTKCKEDDTLLRKNACFLREVLYKLEIIIEQNRKVNNVSENVHSADLEDAEEWQMLARVINRISFVVFLTMYVTGTLYIFLM